MKSCEIVWLVDEKEGRERTIPIYGERFAWWTDAVRRQLKENAALGKAPMDQKRLAEMLEVSEPRLTRAIRRETPSYDLLIGISDVLEIAYPVVLPENEDEALAIAKARRLFRRDAKIADIKAGVDERKTEGQSAAVNSTNARSKRSGTRHAKKP